MHAYQGRDPGHRIVAIVAAGVVSAALITIPANLARADVTETFSYTGSVQTFTVPSNASTITITAIGGGGGAVYDMYDGGGPNGGSGAQVTAVYALPAGTILTIKVGAGGGISGGQSQGGAATAVTGTGVTVVAGGGGGSGPGAAGGNGAASNTAAGGNGDGSTLFGYGGNSGGDGTGGMGNDFVSGCSYGPQAGAAGGAGAANGANGSIPPNGGGGGGYRGGNGGNANTGQPGGAAASFDNASATDGRGGDGAGFGGGGGGYAGGGGGGYGGGGGAANCGSQGAGGAGGSYANDPDATFAPASNGADTDSTFVGANGSVQIIVTTVQVPAPAPTPTSELPPTPTTTPTVAPSSPATPSAAPSPTELKPGVGTIVVNGESVSILVEPTVDGSRLTIIGAGIAFTIDAVGPAGAALPLAPDGSLVLSQSGEFTMSGFGFDPSSSVTLFMFSTPTQLGTLPVPRNGALLGSVTIPASTSTGDHTIQAVGTGVDGMPMTVSLGVRVLTPPAALGAHPTVSLMNPSPKPPGTAFTVVAAGVQARCAVTFWTRGSSVVAKAGIAGHAIATVVAPRRSGTWAVTARVFGSGCEAVSAKTFVLVRD